MSFLLSSVVKASRRFSSWCFLSTCVMVYNRLSKVLRLTESARLTANFRQALLAANVSLKKKMNDAIKA